MNNKRKRTIVLKITEPRRFKCFLLICAIVLFLLGTIVGFVISSLITSPASEEESSANSLYHNLNRFPIPTMTTLPTRSPSPSPTPEVTPEPTAEPTPINPTPAPTKKPEEGVNLGTFKATAYCPCNDCSDGYGRSTASGAVAKQGVTIAADPNVLPLNSRVKLIFPDGYSHLNGVYIVQDVGGGVKGKHIDVFFDNHSSVNGFGRRNITVIKL